MEKFTEVFYWGSDTSGQLGIGDRSLGKSYPHPRCCSFSIPIRKISCGEEHSGFIASNGYVYTMGSNISGRLGINAPSQKYASRPVLVESLIDYQIIDLSCGSQHTGVISTSGLVFTWGSGLHGALGTNESDCAWQPLKVNLPISCTQISCGGRHTAVVTEDSTVCVWGSGDAGQLGTGNRQTQKLPVTLTLENIKQVSCGVFHTLMLTHSGEVLASGGNSFGQLGIGNKESLAIFTKVVGLSDKDIVDVSAGQHSGAITSSGELYVWGTCSFGEYLTPNKLACSGKILDVEIGIGYGMGIDKNGILWAWGSNNSGCLGTGDLESKSQPYPILDLQNKIVTQVSCGASFVIALGKDIETSKPELKKKENYEQNNTKELSVCLEEMKKEIVRLQKGSGGLEELGYKLEQSKIKQGHLQNLYLEEQQQKKELEAVIEGIVQEKEKIRDELRETEKNLYEAHEYSCKVEQELKNKSINLMELQQIYEKVLRDKENMSAELKQISSLSQKIVFLEGIIQEKNSEIENIKKNSAGIASHNNVLTQEIKDIPKYLSKINSLEAQISEKDKEKNQFAKEITKISEENKNLVNKIEKLQNELEKVQFEKKSVEKELEMLPAERNKNQELTIIIKNLENNLHSTESENYAKIESLSKEISVLHENLENSIREINYLKEICEEQNNSEKKLKQDIKGLTQKIEELSKQNKDLDQRLVYQSSANKEFVEDLQKTLYSTVENIKTRTISQKTRTFTNFHEDDLSEIYGKP